MMFKAAAGSVWLWGLLTILATFGATFSGIYLALMLNQQEAAKADQELFRKVVDVMQLDCEVTLDAVRIETHTLDTAPPRSPAVLLETFFQNTLILERIEEDDFVALISSFEALERAEIEMTFLVDQIGRMDPVDLESLYEAEVQIHIAALEDLCETLSSI